jgi:hypothetical protein
MILNDEGYVRFSTDMKTLLKNGYILTIEFCNKDKDGDLDTREYWIKKDDLKVVHDCFVKFISDFGLPRKKEILSMMERIDMR